MLTATAPAWISLAISTGTGLPSVAVLTGTTLVKVGGSKSLVLTKDKQRKKSKNECGELHIRILQKCVTNDRKDGRKVEEVLRMVRLFASAIDKYSLGILSG